MPGKQVLLWIILIITLSGMPFFIAESFRRKGKKDPVKPRSVWLDLLKVISAFLIVQIHTVGKGFSGTFGTEQWFGFLVLNLIPRFAVPIFLMVSGVLMFQHKKTCTNAAKHALKMIILLVIWNLVYFCLRILLGWNDTDVVRQLLAIPVKRQFSGHLWYLYYLVWLYLFSPLLEVLYRNLSIKRRAYFIILTLLIPSVLDLYNTYFGFGGQSAIQSSFSIYMTLSYMGLLFLGRFIHENVNRIPKAKILGLCLAILGFAGALLLTRHYSISHNKPTDIFISENRFFIILYSMGIFIIAASFRNELENLSKRFKAVLSFLSAQSFGIYLFHCIVIWTFADCTVGGFHLSRDGNVLHALLFCVLYYLISIYCVFMLSKVPVLKKLITNK